MVLPELRWVQLVSSEGGLGPECVLPLGRAGVEPLVLAGEVEEPVFAEPPELVADRIVKFAEAAGRENVVASTDCGLAAGSIRRSWAKLDTLVKGADWPRASSGARTATVRSG